jgi:voltage-gated potassium channel
MAQDLEPQPRPRRLLSALRRRDRDEDDGARWWVSLLRSTRNQIVRFLAVIGAAWVVGAIGIHLAERDNPPFDTLTKSLWNAWLMMFSGVDDAPKTPAGRVLTMALLGAGVCLVGLFTGAVASVLVEQRLRRREVASFEMEDHLVLCNWAGRGLEWIREVHSKIIQDKRPVVIIHDQPEAVDLPDTQDEPAFNDVYIVKGDPTNEVILRRARVSRAHSIVVLADDRQGEHADGKTILTCIALRNICKGADVNIAVECRNPNNRHHLKKAGADEIISSDELGLRLLARTALYHGMTHVYQELLTVGRDANELYLMTVPPELAGRDFVEVASMFLRHRNDKRSCLVIGLQRGEEMILNPVGGEAGPLKADDQLVLLSRVFLNPAQALPTVPPIAPATETP